MPLIPILNRGYCIVVYCCSSLSAKSEYRPVSEVAFTPDGKTLVSYGLHSEHIHVFEV